MSLTQSKEFKRPRNVVRLKIRGAKNAVNTLGDAETGKGMSLVCPFPALEVDIPVEFGEGDKMSRGSIHRIGVEDDPKTGLPRLRLAVRSDDNRTTVETSTGQSLLDATRIEHQDDVEVPAERARGPMVRPLVSWTEAFGGGADIELTDGASGDEFSSEDDDPEWVDFRELPLPEELINRKRTRRRYRLMKHMAVAFVLGMLVAAGYLLDKAGMISFGDMSDRIVAAYADREAAADQAVQPVLVEKEDRIAAREEGESALVDKAAGALEEETAASPAVESASYSPGANPLLGEPTPGEESAAAPAPSETVASETAVETIADAEAPADDSLETGPAASSESALEDITLTLPTKWPVEYATAYRVRDPNGVVVDVPGGLVRREGWLESGRDNPLIRSVKAIQRESGARFIVYVNGDLPRFMTSPKGNGVSLRLYYDDNSERTTTVAFLD